MGFRWTLSVLWPHQEAVSSNTDSQPFLLFPSADPQGSPGLGQLPASWNSSSPSKPSEVPRERGNSLIDSQHTPPPQLNALKSF